MPSWRMLTSQASVEYAGDTFQVGDTVHIRLAGSGSAPAQIREIRDLGDGRKLIAIFWYYSKAEVAGRGTGCPSGILRRRMC